jgi:hypothetical protein
MGGSLELTGDSARVSDCSLICLVILHGCP